MNLFMLGNEVESQTSKDELTQTKLQLYYITSICFTENLCILISLSVMVKIIVRSFILSQTLQ